MKKMKKMKNMAEKNLLYRAGVYKVDADNGVYNHVKGQQFEWVLCHFHFIHMLL